MRRIVAAATALVLSAAACSGGGQDIYEVPPEGGDVAAEGPAEEQIQLPDTVAAVPVYAVRKPAGFTPGQLKALEKVPGAAAVAHLKVRTVRVKGPKAAARLRVAAIDPIGFRPVAPSSTRSADFVWLSLLGGDAVLTHDAAKKIGIKDSTNVRVGPAGKIR